MGLSSFFRSKPPEAEDTEGAFTSRAEAESDATRGRTRRKTSKQATQPVDPVLPEKKRARRRLVGALALVLAAVIGLPMVLDSEPKPLADDIVIQIPSKDQPTAQGTRARATTEAAAVIPAGAALDQREEVVDTAAPLVAGKAVSTISTEKSPAVMKPQSEPAIGQSKSSPKTDQPVKTETKSDPKAVQKTVVTLDNPNSADGARARSILDGTAEQTKVDKADKADKADRKDSKPAHLMVQVAALTSKDKVAELQEKLKAAGIASHTQAISTDSGQRIRVRIGPFGSREEADKARARLSGMGLNGTVVPG